MVAVGLLLVGACDDGGDEAGADASTTVQEVEATTTTEAPPTTTTAPITETTTFAQADEPPQLVNTGDDYVAIATSILNFAEWLSVHPQPDLVSEIARPGSAAHDQLSTIFRATSEAGLHTDGRNPAYVTDGRVEIQPAPGVVLVVLSIVNPPYQRLNASGEVVEELPGDPETAVAYEIRQDVGGRWFLENRTRIGLVE